ncbi:hypothetical protein B484DRAFT_425162 [Ochromonadaceae sp. CCMP2298]|nr:hypothetical protein B484DRAFT_425162 [Ochromonadaceae sp. CCMP2298]|eukprot:CAMPEP_0173305924 /NCGR_PEP_ID=MMETSP1143-20121109/20283_1 /TAXON_ID=483371 /ORGANISM="non described non described, Strain CCMP2298" /LENGTH=239 /DNA_ID=CAMNT_0014246935 /DNA_START=40 /DNA_END=759 /DNA_ORIENTATION=-
MTSCLLPKGEMLLQNREYLLDYSQSCIDSIWNLQGAHEVEKLSVLARIKVTEKDAKLHIVNDTMGIGACLDSKKIETFLMKQFNGEQRAGQEEAARGKVQEERFQVASAELEGTICESHLEEAARLGGQNAAQEEKETVCEEALVFTEQSTVDHLRAFFPPEQSSPALWAHCTGNRPPSVEARLLMRRTKAGVELQVRESLRIPARPAAWERVAQLNALSGGMFGEPEACARDAGNATE